MFSNHVHLGQPLISLSDPNNMMTGLTLICPENKDLIR